jgi:hypothetical protein
MTVRRLQVLTALAACTVPHEHGAFTPNNLAHSVHRGASGGLSLARLNSDNVQVRVGVPIATLRLLFEGFAPQAKGAYNR